MSALEAPVELDAEARRRLAQVYQLLLDLASQRQARRNDPDGEPSALPSAPAPQLANQA